MGGLRSARKGGGGGGGGGGGSSFAGGCCPALGSRLKSLHRGPNRNSIVCVCVGGGAQIAVLGEPRPNKD